MFKLKLKYNNLLVDKPIKLTNEKLLKRTEKVKEYKRLMINNEWTKADLARHLGVSRAWVTTVMKAL